MPTISLNLKETKSRIHIYGNASGRLETYLTKEIKGNRLFMIYDSNVYALHKGYFNRVNSKFKPFEFVIPAGEKSKNQNELNRIHHFFLANNISRSDFVLAVGGGVVSDLAGFAAATILRGVKWGIVSTSLLGMVDASIGGKTAINSRYGKNLIGAFYQPAFVLCDPYFLNTLPTREIVCGLGEVVKYCGLIGDEMISLFSSYLNKCDLYDSASLSKIITASARYKAEIVRLDEKESKLRMLLNFGHTVGHAIENALGYGKLRHGEAVILGLYCALDLSQKGRNREKLSGYMKLVENMFALVPYKKIDKNKIYESLRLDKKRINKTQNFILLEYPGKPIITNRVKPADIKKAIAKMLEQYKNRGLR